MTRLGFQVLNAGPLATTERALEVARRAEALGYDSIVVTDHIVVPRTTRSRYPYNATGRLFVPPDADYLEPLALLSFLPCSKSFCLRVFSLLSLAPAHAKTCMHRRAAL